MSPNTSVAVSATGSVQVGGDDGFGASISASFDTEDKTVDVTIEHPGGWSPLPDGSALADTFRTPDFDGSLKIGGDKKYSLNASAQWKKPIDILGIARLSDTKGAGAGPSLSIKVSQDNIDAQGQESPTEWDVEFSARASVIGGPKGLPGLDVEGELSHDGMTTLDMKTTKSWKPLPAALPGLALPKLHGNLKMTKEGDVSVTLKAEKTNFALCDMLKFEDWQGSLSVDSVKKSNTTKVGVSIDGSVLVGGKDGFDADVEVTVDTAKETAVAKIVHDGGWSPLPKGNKLADAFRTPAFDGTLTIGGGKEYAVDATAEWTEPINILDIVTLEDRTGSGSGPKLEVSLEQSKGRTGRKKPPLKWGVEFEGRASLKGVDGLPGLEVSGKFSSSGTTSLNMSTTQDARGMERLWSHSMQQARLEPR